MQPDYRRDLFDAYHIRTSQLDADDPAKQEWFRIYSQSYYVPHLSDVDRATAEVLEVGCNKGFLLASLRDAGFRRLRGVDLSAGDVEVARRNVPEAEIGCEDAFGYLDSRPGQFDVIIMKAVLEHVLKDRVLTLIERVAGALKPDGTVVIDVPNMDWLFAGHERYMDFTHEVGFTKESLTQIVGMVFPRVEVFPADNDLRPGAGLRPRLARLRIGTARTVVRTLLRWANPEGGENPIWARSLIAVAKK